MWKSGWWRAKWGWLLVWLLVGGGALFFTSHNQEFYQRPVARVVAVQTGRPQRQTDQFKNRDTRTSQTLTLALLNTKNRGQRLQVTNVFTASGALDQRYYPGNQVLLNPVKNHRGRLTATIAGAKRDAVLVFLAWLVAGLLLLMMGRAGGMAILSVCLNAVLFALAIQLNLQWQASHVFATFAVLALVFTLISLVLVLGPNKKMLATTAATIIGTAVAMIVAVTVLSLTRSRGVYYESMQYVTQVPRPLFLAEILLGSLGAVMDESADIVATLHELHQLEPTASRRRLFLAGRNVGKSIMGPLINVLFMIFMADTFTSALLYLKNGNNWGYTFAMNMSLGTVQSLVSGIGIVLAIPLVSAFAALLYGRRTDA